MGIRDRDSVWSACSNRWNLLQNKTFPPITKDNVVVFTTIKTLKE